jgi:hypothetical protein
MEPLTGYRVVEFAGIGPGQMGAMLLAESAGSSTNGCPYTIILCGKPALEVV